MLFFRTKLVAAASVALLSSNALAQTAETLEEITVYGQINAAKSAIDQQRYADDIRSVLDVEAAGNFPDQNIAEAMGRLTGVGIVNDQGEGRYVTVRGLGENYNNVQVNGVNLPSPEVGSRAIPLDVIPNDIVSSVEITKTLKPEDDANSLGGSINIVSLSAFDRPARSVRLTGESYYNALAEEWSPKMGITASDTYALGDSGENNFGAAFTVSYFDRTLANDNSETGGGWSQDDNGVVEGTTDLEQRDYLVTRERIGAGLNLDYIASDRTNFYLRSLYSEFADEEIRNATIFEWDDPQLPGAQAGPAAAAKEAKFREETQTIASFNLGGETFTDTWAFEYSAGYSYATEEQDLSSDSGPVFEFDGDLNVGLAGSDILTVLPGAGFDDPANFELDEVELVFVDSEDEITTFRFDATREMTLFGADSRFKFGTKLNLRSKTVDENAFTSDGGDLDSNLSAWADTGIDYTLDPSLAFGVNGPAYSNAILAQTASIELNQSDSAFADSSIDENIVAAYLQLTQNFGDLQLIYGLRAEMTDIDASGFEFFENEETEVTTVTPTNYTRDYTNVFPSISARWNYSDNIVLRGALTTSMARPVFEQITPSVVRTDNPGDDEFSVETGNSELDPLESVNIDLMAEYYPSDNAVFSAGVFYKDITNFIYEGTIDGEGAGLPGYEVETFLNADDAYIFGAEFNAIYTWESGFLLSANMTFVDAETTIDFDGGSRDIQLPNQAESVGNVTVGYESDRLSLRLAASYRSEAFIEAGALDDPFEDVYEDDNLNLQLSGYFNVTDNLQVFAKVQNLTDEPYYAYQSRRDLNFQYETYDVAYYFGFEWSNL